MHDFHFLLKLGAFYTPNLPQVGIANNGARSYLKKSKQALEKKNNQTDQKSPYFFLLHPFPPQLCTFLLLHTHTPVPYQALF